MKTILYNSATQEMMAFFPDGYKVDGQPQSVEPPIYELEYIETAKPDYNPVTQYVTSEWVADLEELTYTLQWTIHDYTAYELAMQDWTYPEFEKRIVAPKSLLFDQSGIAVLMKTWFDIEGLPIESKGNTVRMYCREILADHQAVVDSLQGVITIENKPKNE